jgi:hypothetical protein
MLGMEDVVCIMVVPCSYFDDSSSDFAYLMDRTNVDRLVDDESTEHYWRA